MSSLFALRLFGYRLLKPLTWPVSRAVPIPRPTLFVGPDASPAELESMEARLRAAIQLTPQVASVHATLGDVLMAQGRYNEAASVLAEPVLLVGGEVLELGHQDLAHLAGGAGDQGDAATLRDVLGHRRALADGLVVGVGVDEQQPQGRGLTHGAEPSDPAA